MNSWHAPSPILARYATEPESLDDATASSVELHLLGCAVCRQVVAGSADSATMAGLWNLVIDRIDTPRASAGERLLRGLGVHESVARLVAATPGLRLAWLLAMVLVVAGAVAASAAHGTGGPFLVVAPLVPLASVAVSFAAAANPAGEAGVAAPLTGVGLALRRAVAVLTASAMVVVVGALALPGLRLADAAWVLPALGLALGALALATWMRVETAAGALATLWLFALWLATARTSAPVSELAPLAAPGQVACAVLVAAAIAVLVARRDSFATIGWVDR